MNEIRFWYPYNHGSTDSIEVGFREGLLPNPVQSVDIWQVYKILALQRKESVAMFFWGLHTVRFLAGDPDHLKYSDLSDTLPHGVYMWWFRSNPNGCKHIQHQEFFWW